MLLAVSLAVRSIVGKMQVEPNMNHPTTNSLIIQTPPGTAQQLILLFHGVGSDPQAMQPLGQRLADDFPNAMVVSPAAANPSSLGRGFEWFSVIGITEDNRVDRVSAAMPAFMACVAYWQKQSGVAAAGTALIGFSQGAIMSLESAKQNPPPAGRIVAIGGRFATLPGEGLMDVTVHFLHGKDDGVIPYSNTVQAAHHLRDLGIDVTAEVLPFIGHEIHPEFIELVMTKLTTHIPQRIWAQALAADQGPAPTVTEGTPL
jgi:phospholipase/carboxylesterase